MLSMNAVDHFYGESHTLWGIDLDIPAGGFERVELQLDATPGGTALLQALEEKTLNSLPYRLDGNVESPDEGVLEFSREGFIYTVPGRPGQFR